MKRLCIIPARGGSKRLPDKNWTTLGSKPLIYHTIDACRGLFDNVLISTDSQRYFVYLGTTNDNPDPTGPQRKGYGADLRPLRLATDTSKVIDTVRYYFDKFGSEFDQIWLALPTCPLRTKTDIEMAQGLLTKDIDGVLSITDYEFPPTLGLQKEYGDLMHDWMTDEPWQNDNTRSQDHPKIYRPNGAIYGMWCKSFAKSRNFYTGKVRGYYMPRERSVDIDTELDLKIAEVLLNETKN